MSYEISNVRDNGGGTITAIVTGPEGPLFVSAHVMTVRNVAKGWREEFSRHHTRGELLRNYRVKVRQQQDEARYQDTLQSLEGPVDPKDEIYYL